MWNLSTTAFLVKTLSHSLLPSYMNLRPWLRFHSRPLELFSLFLPSPDICCLDHWITPEKKTIQIELLDKKTSRKSIGAATYLRIFNILIKVSSMDATVVVHLFVSNTVTMLQFGFSLFNTDQASVILLCRIDLWGWYWSVFSMSIYIDNLNDDMEDLDEEVRFWPKNVQSPLIILNPWMSVVFDFKW